jgi:flagellar motor switch/type III secretory pathway protein FliN
MSPGSLRKSVPDPSFFTFRELDSYTRSEVALWNWRQQFLGSVHDWKLWIQDAWGDVLLEPAGWEIGLVQAHSVETQTERRQYSFKQREILIGREASNDVVLDTVAAGKRHARILVEQGRCFVEDLGSSLGTYCNQEPIPANRRRLLQSGDQIAIFPHLFTVTLRQLWSRQLDVSVYAGAAENMTWQEFQETSTSSRTSFAISIHPIAAEICLEVGRAFLMDFADRLLRPLMAENPASILGPTDRAFFEFMILCLIERANRDLSFPFQFEAIGTDLKPSIEQAAKGVCLACSVSLLATTGALRLFVPYASLEAMRQAVPCASVPAGSPSVAWKFPVSVGAVSLLTHELADLERSDVLIFEPGLSLLLPHRFDRGWKASADGFGMSANEISNLKSLQIDNYFEEESLNTEDSRAEKSSEPRPDLSQLPVRVHIILTEKELTLPEASGLTRGAIVDLDCEKSGVVSLAVNGKVLGEGQLVEIDGRLGVKIVSWRGA